MTLSVRSPRIDADPQGSVRFRDDHQQWNPPCRPLWPLAPSLERAQPASQYHVPSGKPHWACEDLLGEWRLPPSGDRSVSTTWRTMSLAVMQTSPNHSLVHNLEQQCCFSSVQLYPQQNLAPYSLLPASSVERVPCMCPGSTVAISRDSRIQVKWQHIIAGQSCVNLECHWLSWQHEGLVRL